MKNIRERENNREHRENTRGSKPGGGGFQKRKWTPMFEEGVKEIDFKDTRVLSRFITERGRILPRKITGLNAQQQKKVTKAIKRARQMSLLPFISYGRN